MPGKCRWAHRGVNFFSGAHQGYPTARTTTPTAGPTAEAGPEPRPRWTNHKLPSSPPNSLPCPGPPANCPAATANHIPSSQTDPPLSPGLAPIRASAGALISTVSTMLVIDSRFWWLTFPDALVPCRRHGPIHKPPQQTGLMALALPRVRGQAKPQAASLRVRLERCHWVIASPLNRVGREPGIQ